MSSSTSKRKKGECGEKEFHNVISMNKLYLNDEGADVRFIFTKDDQETLVPAHKIFLSECSPVFHTMFFGDLKEPGNVKIVDASVDGFKEFLSLFYLDKVTITKGNAAEIAYLSDKYNVDKGLEMCDELLLENTQIDELLTHFELATKFKLQKYCEEKIAVNAIKIFSSDGFFKTTQKMLRMILELNSYNHLANEVFEACIKWAEMDAELVGTDSSEKQTLRNILGKCFYLIPFTAMTLTEFMDVASSNRTMFTIDEVLDIQNFITKGINTEITDKFIKYKTDVLADVVMWNDQSVLACVRNGIVKAYGVFPTEYITFSSTHAILFGGFKFYDINKSEVWIWKDENIKISMLRRGESLAQVFETTELFKKVEYSKSKFMLDRPMIIHPHEKYTIQVKFRKQKMALLGSDCKMTYILQPDISINFHTDSQVRSNNNAARNMISELYFNRL